MKIIRNAIAVGTIAAASLVACSSQHGATGTGNGSSQPQVGSVGQQGNVGTVTALWQIGTGINIYALTWTISGPAGTFGPLTANFGDAQSAEWVAGGIAAGLGYTISVSGADSNNDPCSGTSGTFSVTAGQTTQVQVSVICLQPTDAQAAADVTQGSVAVEAGITVQPVAPFTCPGITSFSISPAELLGTQPATLSILTTGPVSSTTWSVSGCNAVNGPGTGTVGGFVGADGGTPGNQPTVSFSCGSCNGQVTVTASLANAQVEPGSDAATNVCLGAPFTTFTGLINCEGGGALQCFAPTPNACNGACTNTQTDVNNCGTCSNAITGPGASCVGGAGACAAGGTLTGSTCACPTADTYCTGTNACVNIEGSDPNNCGGCGTKCPSGDTCSAGACVAPPSPCTGGTIGNNTPAGCVPCLGSTNGICSSTEQIVINYDILKNGLSTSTTSSVATAAALEAASCYYCLVGGACLDSVAKSSVTTTGSSGTYTVATQNKGGLECGDSANASTLNVGNCSDDFTCVLTSNHCTTVAAGIIDSNASVSNCYCGANQGAACVATATSPIGVCAARITTDMSPTDNPAGPDNANPTEVLSEFTDTTIATGSPGGVGNQLLNCAKAAKCAVCFN
jgi:hypothetical protein